MQMKNRHMTLEDHMEIRSGLLGHVDVNITITFTRFHSGPRDTCKRKAPFPLRKSAHGSARSFGAIQGDCTGQAERYGSARCGDTQ